MCFKKFLILFLIIILSTLFLACSSNTEKIEDANASSEFIKKDDSTKKVITIGSLPYPPYEYFNENGDYVGPGVDLVKEVFDKLDVEYEILVLPWARILELLKSGELDVVLDMYYSDERAEFVDFATSKYGIYPNALFCHNNFKIDFDGSFESIKGMKIGVVRDYYYGKKFENAVKSKLIDVYISNSSEENLQALINGRVNLALETKPVGEHMLKDLDETNSFKALEPPLLTLYSHVAFSKINNLTKLRNQFDEVMKELEESGRAKEVFKKYNLDY